MGVEKNLCWPGWEVSSILHGSGVVYLLDEFGVEV